MAGHEIPKLPEITGNFRQFRWSSASEEAVALVAADELPDTEIAAKAGIQERQLRNWKRHPEFAARVEAIRKAVRDALIAEGITNRQNRLDAYNERWQGLQLIARERAEDMKTVPGGKSGFLVRTHRKLGEDDVIEEYAVDTRYLKEWRELEKQAAIEMGQWAEKREVTGKNGGPIPVEVQERPDLTKLSDEELHALAGLVAKSVADPDPGGD